MRNKREVWSVTETLLMLVLIVLCQPLLAEYVDRQQRFSLNPPEGWQAEVDESGTAIFIAPDGVSSLIILPGEAAESTTLDALPSAYEQLLKDAQPGVSVEMLREERVRLAGQLALQRKYSIRRGAEKRATAMVTFIKVGRLSLTLAATATEAGFAEIEPALRACLQTLRFPAVRGEPAPSPSPVVQPAREIQAKLKALEQARRAGILGDEEYTRKKDELVRQQEKIREVPTPMEALQLRYNVQPGDEFRTRVAIEGKMATEVFQMGGVRGSEELLTYELTSVQKIESVAEDGTFVARIEPIPGTVTMSIDGKPQEVDPELLPEVLLRMTRLGEVVELKYLTASTEIALGREIFDFTGISNTFPIFPEEEIEIGDSWELTPTTRDTGLEGTAKLLGFERVQGYECAIIQIRSSKPISIPEELKGSFARQGLSVNGKIEIDVTQFSELEKGWPLNGSGNTIYEATLFKNGEEISRTMYSFHVSFAGTF
jgi:hypothetical protein